MTGPRQGMRPRLMAVNAAFKVIPRHTPDYPTFFGANVAIVVAGVLAPLRRRAVDRRIQALLALVVLAGFVVLAHPSASVVRAAAMGVVTLLALATGRA